MIPLLLATALGQDLPIPVPLEVVALDVGEACPDLSGENIPGVLRTSVGPAVLQEDGTYSWVCPEPWGGQLDALVASSPDRRQMMVVADGAVWHSDDGLCTVTSVTIPEGQLAVDLAWWRDKFWVLTASEDSRLPSGALLSWDGTALVDLVVWEDMRPGSFAPGGGTQLWVTAMEPTVQVRRISLQGGVSGNVPLPSLPGDVEHLTSFEVRAADENEAWFVLRRSTSTWLWHAIHVAGAANDTVVFTELEFRGRSVLGPIKTDRWWAILDNVLHVAGDDQGTFTPRNADTSPHTCLFGSGSGAFVCRVGDIYALERGEEGAHVFSFLQLGPPAPACTDAACDALWERVADAVGVLGAEETAVCPDGRTASDLEPPKCHCADARGGGWLAAAVAVLALRRRRR